LPTAPALNTLPSRRDVPPRRLYLDLPGVEVDSEVPRSLEVPVGPLAAVGVGKVDVGTTRLVIAVREVEAYELSSLLGPPRVVLDLRAPSRIESQKIEARANASREEPGQVGDVAAGRRGSQAKPVPSVSQASPADNPEDVAQSSRPAEPKPQSQPQGQAAAAPPRIPSPAIAPLKVVIDPGHGGKDPGARGPGGLLEKTVVLAIAKHVASRLREDLGASVVLTRTRDVFVSLGARTALANAERADLFISIHANASTTPSLAGVETYYLENTNDRATLRLAAMENGLRLISDVARKDDEDLTYILSDLVQQGKLQDSIALARVLHRGLVERLGREYRDVVDLGVKRGPFYVLVGAYMPCALVEVAFLTNRVEGRRLGQDRYRRHIADGLVNGVRRYAAGTGRARTL
jgi:N-acetylmuramoyl-L-alanine amidase